MSLLNIDQKKCKQDGLARPTVPWGSFVSKERKATRRFLPKVSRCASAAATAWRFVPMVPWITPSVGPGRMGDRGARHLVDPAKNSGAGRRVKKMQDKPVSSLLVRFIETARYAPTAGNSQLVEWLVINDPKRLHAIAGLLQGAMLASPSLKQAVGIPRDYPFHYPIMIGYVNVRYYRLPERQAPKIHWP